MRQFLRLAALTVARPLRFTLLAILHFLICLKATEQVDRDGTVSWGHREKSLLFPSGGTLVVRTTRQRSRAVSTLGWSTQGRQQGCLMMSLLSVALRQLYPLSVGLIRLYRSCELWLTFFSFCNRSFVLIVKFVVLDILQMPRNHSGRREPEIEVRICYNINMELHLNRCVKSVRSY